MYLDVRAIARGAVDVVQMSRCVIGLARMHGPQCAHMYGPTFPPPLSTLSFPGRS
jgi:hypothetical protein